MAREGACGQPRHQTEQPQTTKRTASPPNEPQRNDQPKQHQSPTTRAAPPTPKTKSGLIGGTEAAGGMNGPGGGLWPAATPIRTTPNHKTHGVATERVTNRSTSKKSRACPHPGHSFPQRRRPPQTQTESPINSLDKPPTSSSRPPPAACRNAPAATPPHQESTALGLHETDPALVRCRKTRLPGSLLR